MLIGTISQQLRRTGILAIAIVCCCTLLGGCARPQRPQRPLPGYLAWNTAMQRNDYVTARSLLTGGNVPQWYADTVALEQQHGPIVTAIGGGGTSGGIQPYETKIRFTWQDGYQRCIGLSESILRNLTVTHNYADCAQVPGGLPSGTYGTREANPATPSTVP